MIPSDRRLNTQKGPFYRCNLPGRYREAKTYDQEENFKETGEIVIFFVTAKKAHPDWGAAEVLLKVHLSILDRWEPDSRYIQVLRKP